MSINTEHKDKTSQDNVHNVQHSNKKVQAYTSIEISYSMSTAHAPFPPLCALLSRC